MKLLLCRKGAKAVRDHGGVSVALDCVRGQLLMLLDLTDVSSAGRKGSGKGGKHRCLRRGRTVSVYISCRQENE